MLPEIKPITGPIELGEGPHWDSVNQCLYFVDLTKSAIHKYDSRTNVHTAARVGDEPVSIIIPVKDKKNTFLISYGNDLALIEWDGISEQVVNLKTIVRVDEREDNRLNDGKVGPNGELLIGSMSRILSEHNFEKKSSLYCYKNGVVKELFGNVGISNGLAWSSNQKVCFYVDTCRNEVTCYDYDPSADPVITNDRTAFSFEATNTYGCPDGITIDVNDKLWVANFLGGEILHIDPETGKLLNSVKMPSAHITSAVFGGPNLDELYVTSASFDLSARPNETYSHAGSVFRITGLGAKGTENWPMVSL